MKRILILFAAALLTLLPTLGEAAVLGAINYNYGRGLYEPDGNHRLLADHVRISEDASQTFYDQFDFSGLGRIEVESLTLTLEYDYAGPNVWRNLVLLEGWRANVGAGGGSPTSAFVSEWLQDPLSPQSIELSLTSAGAGATAFAEAVASKSVGFWFDEVGFFGGQTFRLYGATLTVAGTTVVPLPAPILLLLSALGGLGALSRLQRRRAAYKAAALDLSIPKAETVTHY